MSIICTKTFASRIVKCGIQFYNLTQLVEKQYRDNNFNADYEAVTEIVANFTQNYVMTDLKTARRIIEANPTLGRKILYFLQDMVERMKATFNGNTDYYKAVVNARDIFAKSINEQNVNFENGVYKNGESGYNGGNKRFLFAGNKAKTSNKSMLNVAKEMLKKGESSEKILKNTGWFKGKDNKWRFEINDREAKVVLQQDFKKGKLGDIFKHQKLYAAYPFIKDINVEVRNLDNTPDEKYGGYYSSTENLIVIRDTFFDKNQFDTEKIKSVFLHEIQHAIQDYEGFERGGNADYALKFVRDSAIDYLIENNDTGYMNALNNGTLNELSDYVDDFIRRQYNETDMDKIAYKAYMALYGEQEARLVQKRANLTDEERREYSPEIKKGILLNEYQDENNSVLQTSHPDFVVSALYKMETETRNEKSKQNSLQSNEKGEQRRVKFSLPENNRGILPPKKGETVTDSYYRSLVLKGDMETARAIVEDAAEKAGYTGEFETVVRNESGDIIPPSKRFDNSKGDIRFAIPEETQKAKEEAIEKFGTVKKGENPARDIDVAKAVGDGTRKTKVHTRTILEGGLTTPEVSAAIEEGLYKGSEAFTYLPLKNVEQAGKARADIIKDGFEKAFEDITKIVESPGQYKLLNEQTGGKLSEELKRLTAKQAEVLIDNEELRNLYLDTRRGIGDVKKNERKSSENYGETGYTGEHKGNEKEKGQGLNKKFSIPEETQKVEASDNTKREVRGQVDTIGRNANVPSEFIDRMKEAALNGDEKFTYIPEKNLDQVTYSFDVPNFYLSSVCNFSHSCSIFLTVRQS